MTRYGLCDEVIAACPTETAKLEAYLVERSTVDHYRKQVEIGFVANEGSRRTIPLAKRLYAVLKAIEKDKQYVASELGVPFGSPYVLGTPDPKSRPYHPSQLTKGFHAFCKMNGFGLTFHDLLHAFATMVIAGGNARFAHDVCTVASYLGIPTWP